MDSTPGPASADQGRLPFRPTQYVNICSMQTAPLRHAAWLGLEAHAGVLESGRQDRFRTGCSEERVGSSPSARTHLVTMRPLQDVAVVLELGGNGLHASEIARRTGIPRATVRDWLAGRIPRKARTQGGTTISCEACGAPEHRFADLPPAYVLPARLVPGRRLHLGASPRRLPAQGESRSSVPGHCRRVRSSDPPANPGRRVHRLNRRSSYTGRPEYTHVEVSSYSKTWPCLFPQHGPGRKHHRPIELAGWQQEMVAGHPELLLRGLVHSDGCRFINTGRASGAIRATRSAISRTTSSTSSATHAT